MKAIKIELILIDNKDAEYFITKILPKFKKEYKMKQILYSNAEYFEK